MAFVPIYILILGVTIVVDYFAGIFIEHAKGRRRKTLLIVSLVANIAVLCVFKYFNFLNDNFAFLMHGFGLANPIPYLPILLPIGLSFHTFQAMSYTIEVYRGNQKAEKHFGIYALYVMFYPQLVAGPIERPQNLLHQFREKHEVDYSRIVEGLKLILWGFFKKLVIADRLAIYVNAVYNNTDHHSGFSFFVATIFFAFQIYCDFSAYSDIAIGVSKVMGFHLMTNFNRPYFARNVAEFWKRWHISLSTWFKDYLYFSIGGNKVSVPRWYFNLFIVFLISGLWHGANWTYIIWGALNGFYLIFGNISLNFRTKFEKTIGLTNLPNLARFIQISVTFLLICFSWIFFRVNNFNDAITIIKKITTLKGPLFIENPSKMIYSLAGIATLLLIEYKREYYRGTVSFFNNKYWIIRNMSYASLVIIILLFGVFDGGQFIYFQF
ncbi:MBOAT family O-acyltransferase [Pedobacter alpinus]|uniref:MBOAT family O-acyltransferase n=1 Tax=Pedobacter alpinus TaxID=1590643 RepID=A0ABW5TRI1_9SPHI